MERLKIINGILSIMIIITLAISWFEIFPPSINQFVFHRLFYILMGISFVLQAQLFSNSKFKNPMYGASALCVIGAMLPMDDRFLYIKTIGLLGGVIIGFLNRRTIS